MGRFSSGKMNGFDEGHFELEAFDDAEFEGTLETFTVFVPTDMVNLSRIPDDYDYDMETSHNTFFWDELLPTLIVYCLTFVLGLVGNVLIIFTIFRYRKMKSTTNVFLASLASSDLLLILFCIPVKDFKKCATWSHSRLKDVETSPSDFRFQLANARVKNKGERLQTVHRLHHESTNPFGSKDAMPEELCYKSSTLESSTQNETELDKIGLVEISSSASNVSSHSEEVIVQLPKDLKEYAEFIRNLRKPKKESREDDVLVKSSKSYDKNTRCNIGYDNSNRDCKVDFMYSFPFWQKQTQKAKSGKKIKLRRKHSSDKAKSKCRENTESILGKCLSSSERLTDSSTSDKSRNKKSHSVKKCHKEHRHKKVQICCGDHADLNKRVTCLEKEIEQIRKRISSFNPGSTATCKTREINVKNQRESKQHQNYCDHYHREPDQKHQQKQKHHCSHYQQQQQENQQEKIACYPIKATSSEAIVQNSKSRDLCLKSSTSDCHLNVGMEIKMENADPITGKKLGGGISRSFQQDGNIQCRLFEQGQTPLLVLDADFQYNPRTGMLFKNQESSGAAKQSKGTALPLKALKEPKTATIDSGRRFSKTKHSHQAFACSQKVSNGVPGNNADGRKCISLEHNSLENIKTHKCPNIRSKRSQSLESSNNNVETKLHSAGKESKTIDALKEKFREREAPQRSSHSARSKTGRQPKSGRSFIPTRRKPTPSLMGRSTSATSSLLSLAASAKSSMHESYSLPSSKQSLAKLFSFTWTFGFFLCKLVHYMQSVSAICSVLTLTAMSLERYYAIVHPMKAQYICTISQARRIITGTWVSAFLLAVPILFAQVHLRVGVKVEAYWCVRDWDNKIVWRAHELYMFLLILIVPTGVMAVAYTAICWEIWEVMQRRQDMTSGKEQRFCKKPVRNSSTESFPSFNYTNNPSRLGNKRRGRVLLKKELADDTSSVKQVIKMLVAVLVIYVLCWGPMLIDNVLQAYGILSHIRMGWLKYMGTAFHLMAYFNSCINPIIYGFMSKNFRDSFRKTLCCMGRKQKMALRSFSLSQTRNTSIRYAESSFSRAVSIALPV